MKWILAILLSMTVGINAADYYVDFASGNDANPGTIGSPLKYHPWMASFSGSTALGAGDTVHMKRGETWTLISSPSGKLLTVGASGSSGNPITTTSYGAGDQPLIDVTGTNLCFDVYGIGKSYIAFNDLHIRGGGYGIYFEKTGGTVCHDWTITSNHIEQVSQVCILGADDSYNITVGDTSQISTATSTSFNNHFHDFGYAGIQLLGCDPVTRTSNFQVAYNYIHTTTTTGCGNNTYGIAFTAGVSSTAYPTIAVAKYNRVEDIPIWEGLDAHGGSYIYFQNNAVSNCLRGVTLGTASIPGVTILGDHMYVQGNTIEIPPDTPCLSSGGFVTVAKNVYVITNLVISSNVMRYTSQPTNAVSVNGLALYAGDTASISDNEIYNLPSAGTSTAILFEPPGPFSNITVSGNRIHDSRYYGIAIQTILSGKVTIDYNAIACNVPIAVVDYDLTYDTDLLNNSLQTTSNPLVYFLTTGVSNTVTFTEKNNILTYASPLAQYYINGPSTTNEGTYVINNNLYTNSTFSTPWDLPGRASANLATWQAAGFDTWGNPVKDPLYVGGGNFHLTYLSPAIDSGQSVGLTGDLLGNPIYGTPDIGAYEYQPPLTTGADSIDVAGCARIYKDGKFRNLFATNGTLTSLTVAPAGGWTTYLSGQVRPEWMNVTNISWVVNGTKTWTLYSTNETGLVSVTVGDLGTNYRCSIVQDSLEITNFVSTGSSFTFTYMSDSSPHTFSLTEKAMATSTFSGAKLSGVFIR